MSSLSFWQHRASAFLAIGLSAAVALGLTPEWDTSLGSARAEVKQGLPADPDRGVGIPAPATLAEQVQETENDPLCTELPDACALLVDALNTAIRMEATRRRPGVQPMTYARMLSEIARAQAVLGMVDQATLTFALALEAARARTYDGNAALPIAIVAVAQTRAGMSEEARQTLAEAVAAAGEEGRELEQARILFGIAEAQESAGLYDDALATAALIDDRILRNRVLYEIAVAQSSEGQFAEALSTAYRIEFSENAWGAGWSEAPDERYRTLREIAIAQAEAMLLEDAMSTAGDIARDIMRVEALAGIAAAQALAGLEDDARRTFEIASAEARAALPPGFTEERRYIPRSQAFASVAAALGTAGWFADGVRAIAEVDVTHLRSEAFSAIAGAQAAAGYPEVARSVFSIAIAAAGEIVNDGDRSRALARIAGDQALGGLTADALDTAGELARGYWHVEALNAIVAAQLAAGLFADARATANEIDDFGDRGEALLTVIRAQASMGLFDDALAAAEAMGHSRWPAFAEIAAAQAEAAVALYLDRQ